jgi:hypothetical protein
MAISTSRGRIPRLPQAAEANVVAMERPHPLNGVRSAYYICERKSMKNLSWIRRWAIRFVYAKCEWASDYCIHDMGIFTDRDVAEEIARQKSKETGNLWSAKELPVNGLLPDESVRYGFYTMPASEGNEFYQKHRTRFEPIAADALKVIDQKTEQIWKSVSA